MPNRRPTVTTNRVLSAWFTLAWAIPLLLPGTTLALYPPIFLRYFHADWVLGALMLLALVLQHVKLVDRKLPWWTTTVGSAFAGMLWGLIAVLIILNIPKSPGGYVYLGIALLQARVYYESVQERDHRPLGPGL